MLHRLCHLWEQGRYRLDAKEAVRLSRLAADHNVWSFTVGNDFFELDPNPGVPKVAVVTYRYQLEYGAGYSTCQTAVAGENQTLTIQCPQPLTRFTWPAPGLANECIIAAYWYNKNVTSQVDVTFNNMATNPDLVHGVAIPVNTNELGDDPAPGISKQLTIVYAKYINQKWYHCTVVDLRSDRYADP